MDRKYPIPEQYKPYEYIFDKLTEELQPYVSFHDRIGPILKHPLVYRVPLFPDERIVAECNTELEKKKEALVVAKEEHDWSTYLFLHERPYRIDALYNNIWDDIEAPKRGELLSHAWTDTENPSDCADEWVYMFNEMMRSDFADSLMSEEDKAHFASLPDKVTIYRGMDAFEYKLLADSGVCGISWSLSEDRAKWFATRFDPNGKVASREVNKSDLVCYFSSRSEDEVIYLKGHIM